MLLRALSTDYYYQGKGHTKQSLLLLPDFVRKEYPHISEIVLASDKCEKHYCTIII
ncbi:hypothetical protein [Bacillus cereus]|uniref:hypothetical protein n=1 Tax=Bacillus cereus TaxID=1396 RepID=UPI0015D4BA44|nr:hypothetical protein [Bacillus cereus]